MKIVRQFPHEVRVIENMWIPMSDGLRLAARIWLPIDAEERPVPALLECMPYRKRDFTRPRDEPLHHYFAGHGYASLRIDLRGAGDSEGLLADEYTPQEQADIVDAIAWVARQPWCSGKAGMFGISWGGFNALQVAARRPPGLEAIISMCASDDRYADDAHYQGGCLLTENLIWGSQFLAVAGAPPDPEIAGDVWRQMWRHRLENLELFPARWMRHQQRDDYWKQGSICEDYGAIDCAVYAIGGWADGYTNAIARLMEHLESPRKALIGPWSHSFPHVGAPGPNIGVFQEMRRWWDHWLKGIDTGIMDEPMIRAWMEEYVRPSPRYAERPGRWIAEDRWPSERITARRLYLNVLSLGERADPEDRMHVRAPESTGLAGGDWYGFGAEGESAIDQREDDGKSLIFDSDPLAERVEIFGAPELELELSVDRPVAHVTARLNEVAPDGASTRVSLGSLNLCQRDSREEPEPLAPGRRYRVKLRLNDVAYAFAPGNTIRVSLSTAYWPMVWPAPAPVKLTVYTGRSSLSLPVRPGRSEDAELRPFDAPERAPRPDVTELRPAVAKRQVRRDLTTGETVYEVFSDGGDFGGAALARLDDIDLVVGYTIRKTFRIHEYDPSEAEMVVEQRTEHRRGEWSTRLEWTTRLTADAEHFYLEARLVASLGDERFVVREWEETIPRVLL